MLTLTIKELLTNKGIKVQEEHLKALDERWEGIKQLRGDLSGVAVDDADISLRNIPGGDHVE